MLVFGPYLVLTTNGNSKKERGYKVGMSQAMDILTYISSDSKFL